MWYVNYFFLKNVTWANSKLQWSNEEFKYNIRTPVVILLCIILYFENSQTEKCLNKWSKEKKMICFSLFFKRNITLY